LNTQNNIEAGEIHR